MNNLPWDSSGSLGEGISREEKVRLLSLLSEMRSKLLLVAQNSGLPKDQADRVISVMAKELDELEESANKLTKKDWKNQFVSAMVSLIFLFSFSAEARTTVHYYYQQFINIVYNETAEPFQIPPVNESLLPDGS